MARVPVSTNGFLPKPMTRAMEIARKHSAYAVGHHGDGVDAVVDEVGPPDHQVGNHDRQQDNGRQGDDAHEDCVARGPQQQLVQRRPIIGQGVALLEHAHFGIPEGHINDVDLRQQGHRHNAITEYVH